jgi:hypothetical protein
VSNPFRYTGVIWDSSTGLFAHFYDFDFRFAHRIPPNQQFLPQIHDLLRKK